MLQAVACWPCLSKLSEGGLTAASKAHTPPQADTHEQEQSLDAVRVLGTRGVCLLPPPLILAQWQARLKGTSEFRSGVDSARIMPVDRLLGARPNEP